MYASFYGFSEMPFALQPDPSFLFFSRKHKLALTLMRYGVSNKALCSVVTGDIGSGKTTLVRQLMAELDPAITVGLIFNTHRGMGNILRWISMAFGLPYQDKDSLQLHEAFLDFLLERFVAGAHAVLIVDEAQNLTPDSLEELRVITNFNTEKDTLLQLILVGQPELRDTLRSPGFEQFAQRISVQYHLEPLERDETAQYIHHRLRVAGGDGRTFDDEACQKIWYYSRGVPRVINVLCDAALLYGYAEERRFIDRWVVEEVILDRRRVGIMDLPAAEHEPPYEDHSARDSLTRRPLRVLSGGGPLNELNRDPRNGMAQSSSPPPAGRADTEDPSG
jgi:type II secretory pathway predicted ATPase ExeA